MSDASTDPRYADPRPSHPDEHHSHTVSHVQLPPGLDSGDIVLFNRRCTSMPLAGAVLCKLSKLTSNSQWDHVGLVVRHPATGELLFLEADFGGVKLRSLAERVRRSKSNEIAVRQLSIVRNSSMRETLYAFAQEMVGRPYEIGTGTVMVRISDPVAKKEKEYLNALIVEKQTIVRDIENELRTASISVFQQRILQGERDRVAAEIHRLKKRLDPRFEPNSPMEHTHSPAEPQISTKYKGDLSRVFCSELVAAAYQRAHLIGPYPPPFYYSPKDFSSEDANIPGVMLLNNVKLSKEKYLRRSVRAARELVNRRRSFGNVYDGEKPTREHRALIRDAFKRTPLYSLVPDEYKRNQLLKSFRARIVEPGDVVFEQGDYGDKFYIVASGEVERWHSRDDQPPILLSTIGPRTSFGLTGFSFNNVARVATLRAKHKTLLWELDRPTFERFKDASGDTQSIISAADQRLLRRHLQEHFLFKRLDKIGPNELQPFFMVKFRAGEHVFEQGDTGDNMYIIKSGELERHTRNPKARRVGQNNTEVVDDEQGSLVKTLNAGQSFGELSLMYNAPRAATIRARTDSECWAISAAAYHLLSLGGGNQHLRTVFKKIASVEKDGEPYMTKDDLLKFIGVHAFPEKDRERLAALLISLIASNRAKDPIASRGRKNGRKSEASGSQHELAGTALENEAESDILLSFWEFCRFDIIINNPDADMEVAFRKSDQSNTGFISLDDMEELLHEYAEYDPVAQDMLTGENPMLRTVFGRHGTRTLSMKDFGQVSKDILPPLFRKDIQTIRDHFLDADVVGSAAYNEKDLEDVPFLEPYAAPTLLGSKFVGTKALPVSTRSPLQTHSVYPPNVPTWMANVKWSDWVTLCLTGVVSRTAVAPLERVKMLMQTGNQAQYSGGWISSMRQMIAEESTIRRALFRQNGANILRTVPSTIIQTALVTRLATSPDVARWFSSPGWGADDNSAGSAGSRGSNRTLVALFAGGLAGMVSQTATYPFDFVRARLAMQRRGFEPYRGPFHGINEAMRAEGVRSIYRGLFPTLVGSFAFTGITLAVYETCLLPILPRRNSDTTNSPTPGGLVAAGIVTNMTSQLATYPIDTCRRRMQVAGFDARSGSQSTSFVNAWTEIGRQMGWRGYFRGVMPNLLKIAPSTAVSLLVYEQLRPRVDAAEGAVGRLLSQSSPHVRSSS